MKERRHLSILIAAAALSLILASCGRVGMPVAPTLDADETRRALDSVGMDAARAASTAGQSSAAAALAGLAGHVHGLPGSAAGSLPRGRYLWAGTGPVWTYLGPSEQLVLTWPFGRLPPRDATLDIDWNATAPTVRVGLPGGGTQEMPQDALVTLQVGGSDSGRLKLAATWQNTDCGLILEPARLDLSGYLGEAGDRFTLHGLTLSVSDAGSVTTIASTGDVSLIADSLGSAGTTTMSFDWDVVLRGDSSRAASDCSLTGFDVRDGHIGFGIGAQEHDLAFFTGFSNLRYEQGALTAIDLSAGRLGVDGAVAVTFEGTLDDADHNGFPGDNLTLTFKEDVTMTLEAFLEDHIVPITAFRRLLSPLLR